MFDRDIDAVNLLNEQVKLRDKKGFWYNLIKDHIYNELCSKYSLNIHPRVEFGENVYIAHSFNILIGKTTKICDNVCIYPNVSIIAKVTDDDILNEKNLRRHAIIGNGTVLGAGCTIIGNITIGNNCFIAAGAIVTKDIPDNCLVKGINEIITDYSFSISTKLDNRKMINKK